MDLTGLHTLDYLVFFMYLVVVAGYGYWVFRKKSNTSDTASGFFLAEGSLTFWAIGAADHDALTPRFTERVYDIRSHAGNFRNISLKILCRCHDPSVLGFGQHDIGGFCIFDEID